MVGVVVEVEVEVEVVVVVVVGVGVGVEVVVVVEVVTTKQTGRRAAIARAKLVYKENKSLHAVFSVNAATKLGVAESTIRNWRKEFGLTVPGPQRCSKEEHQKKVALLEQDPDLGINDGMAKRSLKSLGKRHGLSTTAVKRIMDRFDIEPCYKSIRTLIDYSLESKENAKMFIGWKRPRGMDVHLEYLSEQRK